ncbi:MAG: hypothetical protein IOC90_13265 [Methylocystis sp.]|nr:hypothetical protein [Methylocystis sp.]MCA3588984.1 hypothetical protein [Methylocystis sp.]MCA3593433.1 hypothetical protein [Methylocystis sp.]
MALAVVAYGIKLFLKQRDNVCRQRGVCQLNVGKVSLFSRGYELTEAQEHA